ncbi:ATP-binding protein [Candidatus Woesearchaeota archaeon]|nr:ATP-binding protein [Candidatus Woesearchaeota archaeon]
MPKISHIINKLRRLNDKEKVSLNTIQEYIKDTERIKLIKSLLKERKISIEYKKLELNITDHIHYPEIKAETENIDVSDINSDIRKGAEKKLFKVFSHKAFEELPKYIATNIKGMEDARKAIALQLFSAQPIHILLLGDPGTGKTDLLRAASELSPIASFGLGSGTSGAGLVVTVRGNEIIKGILPKADKGLCCIDELNLMKEDSRAGLYNAMEKGFVTYDKGGHHYKFDARIKVLATANPRGDRFRGKTISELKKEMPFDPALLTRFHLIFLVRKPDFRRFREIADKIVSGEKKKVNEADKEFIKDYVEYTNKIEKVEFPKEMHKEIVDFVAQIKKYETKYLIEVSPRLVIGIMRLCKALAKMELREKVEKKDISRIKDIVKNSLKIE